MNGRAAARSGEWAQHFKNASCLLHAFVHFNPVVLGTNSGVLSAKLESLEGAVNYSTAFTGGEIRRQAADDATVSAAAESTTYSDCINDSVDCSRVARRILVYYSALKLLICRVPMAHKHRNKQKRRNTTDRKFYTLSS